MTEDNDQSEPDVTTKISTRSVADTVARLTDLIAAKKGLKLFAVIDQAAEAKTAGLELRDTTLVIFGSPAAGTPVMDARPLAALDLPLKVLVWAGDDGRTQVSYYDPAAVAARHHLAAELGERLAAVDPLTDALIAS
ncbi:MAG TPA: DUF302 domain-containing protein [Streptosporangiaceae bacterium]|nr:DUF302 domain-containing protein [Streptosporangiaceae bacterium]